MALTRVWGCGFPFDLHGISGSGDPESKIQEIENSGVGKGCDVLLPQGRALTQPSHLRHNCNRIPEIRSSLTIFEAFSQLHKKPNRSDTLKDANMHECCPALSFIFAS